MPISSLMEKISTDIEKEDLVLVEGSINFPLVFHIHQPVGNFPWVFDNAYDKSYEPLLAALERHSGVHAGLHITGPVLDWLELNQPIFLQRLKELVKRRQVELLGGGYYEPILAVIPDRDKLAQITLLTDRLQELVGAETKGFWLAERAWEPHLPCVLADANIEYVLIDDNHVRACGIGEQDLMHVFATEDQGEFVAIFPINEKIRYLTPWKPAIETYKYLRNLVAEDDPERIITSIDDAEKFGVWPAGDRTTYDICFGSGYEGYPWIDLWFGFLEQLSWVVSCTPGEYLSKIKPRKLVYLPTVSYDKMDRWALPTQARREVETLVEDLKWGRIFSVDINEKKTDMNEIIRSHIRGGFWRHFLVKYPESNRMHKRMLHARKAILLAENASDCSSNYFKEPWDEIYKAQCNDVYWHGLFAGVYYLFLRRETYHHILRAEHLVQRWLDKKYPVVEEVDIEIPGHPEIILENQALKVFIRPSDGCIIPEIDLKTMFENVGCVLTRREEAYHEMDAELQLDKWQKASFRDWILPCAFSSEDLLAGDIIDDYGVTSAQYHKDSMEEGHIQFHHDLCKEDANLCISKTFSLDIENTRLSVVYKINVGQIPPKWLYSSAVYTEICLVLGLSSETLHMEQKDQELVLFDSQTGLVANVSLSEGKIAAVGPITPLLKSEGEWQSSYQGHSIFLCVPLDMSSDNLSWTVHLTFKNRNSDTRS